MSDSSELRWQSYLRHAAEPLFLLNRQRRLLFANRAWEVCTGLSLAAARGRPCRPARARDRDAEPAALPLPVLAPPPEALAGQCCRARRRALEPARGWWQLDFFPLLGEQGLLGILGKITPLPTAPADSTPLPERLLALRDRQAEAYRIDALPEEPPAMRRVLDQARLASQSRLPVTLLGEPGSGKHWLARAIHHASPARERAFARLDCRALPEVLLPHLLYAPRLALGTVYLREPAELPRELQQRLARQLRAGGDSADAPRLIFGHRGDPADAIRAGRLLDELHFAASTLTIFLPPLRERLDDLDRLIPAFLARACRFADLAVRDLSAEAAQALRAHTWPGNLRELFEVLRAAATRAKGERIELADLPFFLRNGPMPAEKKMPLDEWLAEAERRLILLALRQARGNRTRAAELLGIWRPRLLRRLDHFGIAAGDDTE